MKLSVLTSSPASLWLVDMDKPEIEFKDEAQETYLDLQLDAKTPGLEFGHLGQVGGAKGSGTAQITLPGSSPSPGGLLIPTLPVPGESLQALMRTPSVTTRVQDFPAEVKFLQTLVSGP